jgi:hypothetical protein
MAINVFEIMADRHPSDLAGNLDGLSESGPSSSHRGVNESQSGCDRTRLAFERAAHLVNPERRQRVQVQVVNKAIIELPPLGRLSAAD